MQLLLLTSLLVASRTSAFNWPRHSLMRSRRRLSISGFFICNNINVTFNCCVAKSPLRSTYAIRIKHSVTICIPVSIYIRNTTHNKASRTRAFRVTNPVPSDVLQVNNACLLRKHQRGITAVSSTKTRQTLLLNKSDK